MSSTADSLLVRSLKGQPVPRPPVWFMRQAGRYMANYRAIRAEVSFLELCADPDLCCEVTLQPLNRFGFDAGIIFSDILLPLASMGRELIFGKGHGPQFPNPVRTRADVDSLTSFDPVRDLPAVLRAIELTVAAADVPILGFAGSPFTLACYLVEGGGSKNWEKTKSLMWQEPETFQLLLNKLADAVGDHLQAQVEAGAAAVQLFDTWAGALSSEDFQRFALPAAQRALARVSGAGPFLPWLNDAGADAVGLDWRVDMARARAELGDTPVQGNLDPIALFAPPEEIRRKVHDIIRAAGPTGHVFNLGHGIIPSTPMAGVQAAVAAVQEWSWTD
jgi:uroporphyrinogen decarboxylase